MAKDAKAVRGGERCIGRPIMQGEREKPPCSTVQRLRKRPHLFDALALRSDDLIQKRHQRLTQRHVQRRLTEQHRALVVRHHTSEEIAADAPCHRLLHAARHLADDLRALLPVPLHLAKGRLGTAAAPIDRFELFDVFCLFVDDGTRDVLQLRFLDIAQHIAAQSDGGFVMREHLPDENLGQAARKRRGAHLGCHLPRDLLRYGLIRAHLTGRMLHGRSPRFIPTLCGVC